MSLTTYSFVFARGGSKGLPKKNIRSLLNKPLIGHALTVSNCTPEIQRTFVSTDCEEIASVAIQFGATVIDRPSHLAQDDSPEWLAWRHATEWVRSHYGEFDCFVSLPATAPLRTVDDVSRCIAALTDQIDAVVTISPASRSPWFNMVKKDNDGLLSILIENDTKIVRRQDVPVAYDLATVAYVARPDFILNSKGLWGGRVRGVLVAQEHAIDIDTEYDFKLAELLMAARQEKYK